MSYRVTDDRWQEAVHIEYKAMRAGEVARVRNIEELYKVTKQMSGEFSNNYKMVKVQNGNVLSKE